MKSKRQQIKANAACLFRKQGYKAHSKTYMKHVLMGGKVFDPDKAEAYATSFAISNL